MPIGWSPGGVLPRLRRTWTAAERNGQQNLPGWRSQPFGVVRILNRVAGVFSRTKSVEVRGISVSIEQLAPNQRRINSSCIVASAMEDVWDILTDYNRLSEHVPNLVQSRLVPHPDPQGIRLFQEGAQKIIGFQFRAAVTMDMREVRSQDSTSNSSRTMAVLFDLVESDMFQEFSGEWRLHPEVPSPEELDEVPAPAGDVEGILITRPQELTRLCYTVTIKPKGVVPVQALEWRIKEDVPTNVLAIKAASELRYRQALLTSLSRPG